MTGLNKEAKGNKQTKATYTQICELAFGCIPNDIDWAKNTEVYKRIEQQLKQLEEQKILLIEKI